ncbi:hypothetical protein [Spirosoma aerophilum]
MGEEISARLIALRKHLSDRLGEKLTMEIVAERSNLTEQQVHRLERGLAGTPISLLGLLHFYGSHGYNMNWIISPDNSRVPLILSSGSELQDIGEIIREIRESLDAGHTRLNEQLRVLGYNSLEKGYVAEESEMPEPEGLIA